MFIIKGNTLFGAKAYVREGLVNLFEVRGRSEVKSMGGGVAGCGGGR